MTNKKRLIPEWPFPSYIFVPGDNPHPKKAQGHMEGEKDPIAEKIDLDAPKKNLHLRYGLDLYNHGYFWESHVYFEALWNAHGRRGPVADFLKALIKLGAAGVKLSIDQKVAASGHFDRAIELLQGVRSEVGNEFLGFNLLDLERQIKEGGEISLYPSWT